MFQNTHRKTLSAPSKCSGQRVEKKSQRRKIFLPAAGWARRVGVEAIPHTISALSPPFGSGFFFFFSTSSSPLGSFQRSGEGDRTSEKGGKGNQNESKS